MVGTNLGKCEWVWEEKLKWLNPRWWNSSWQNSRWLLSSNWVRKNEWSFFVQNGWIQYGRIQYGCHHQVESEWMSEVFVVWFWLNLMMAAILNSDILDSAICTKKLHSFFLTQFDDSSHLEFCQLEFHHLGFNHFSFFSQTHSHLPRLVPTICTKKLHSFILTQLDDCSYLEICPPQFSHFVQKILHSFILTQLDDGSHQELCHVGFRHCHLGLRHLVIFSQIHSKTLFFHSDSDSN